MINPFFLLSQMMVTMFLRCSMSIKKGGSPLWGVEEVNVEYHFSGWWHTRERACEQEEMSKIGFLIVQTCVSSWRMRRRKNKQQKANIIHSLSSSLTSHFGDSIKGSFSRLNEIIALSSPYQIIALMVSQQRIYYGSRRASGMREIN